MPLSNMAVRDIETVIHPYTNLARHREVGPLILNEGRGIYLYDDTGKRYIEGMAGLWCTALGYGNQEIAEAGAEALRKVSFTHAFSGKSHDGVIELSEKLKEIAPCPASKVLFGSSGSEANDMQMKLSWYYNNARGKREKKKIISRVRAYHGVTIASASLTGLPWVHNDFDLPIANVLHTSCPHYYRFGQDGETEAAVRPAHGGRPRAADHPRRAGHDRRLHRRAADGCGRRAHAACGLLGEGQRHPRQI